MLLDADELFEVMARPIATYVFQASPSLNAASAPEPRPYQWRQRSIRARQTEVVQSFERLLEGRSELRATWAETDLRTRALYLSWMAHPWRRANRDDRAHRTVRYLESHSLKAMVQHPKWGDAFGVMEARLYLPPIPDAAEQMPVSRDDASGSGVWPDLL
jgi:hypothetical protein